MWGSWFKPSALKVTFTGSADLSKQDSCQFSVYLSFFSMIMSDDLDERHNESVKDYTSSLHLQRSLLIIKYNDPNTSLLATSTSRSARRST